MSTMFEKTITAGYPRTVLPLSAVGDSGKEKTGSGVTIGYLLSTNFYRGKDTPSQPCSTALPRHPPIASR